MAIKNNRIEIRVSNETKKILERAAEASDLSLSSYIVSICLKQAKLDLERNEIIMLSNSDRNRLLKELKKSSVPTKALKDLFKNH